MGVVHGKCDDYSKSSCTTGDGAFVEYWLALVLSTIPETSGNIDPISKFIQVLKSPATLVYIVFSMGNTIWSAQVIP